jgi:hypothetical protein
MESRTPARILGGLRLSNDRALALVSAACLSTLYGMTLLRTVGWSDIANFQFIGRVLGITHPPGYPLYALATHALTWWVPHGWLALAVNALSALFSVAALDLLRRFLVRAGVARPLALALSLLAGVQLIVWRESLHAEVYTLHLLLSCATFVGFQRWSQTRQDRDLLVGCFIYALSFGNHLNTVTLLPAVVLLVWEVDRRVFLRPRLLGKIAALVLVCAAQYLYLVVRSRAPAAYCEVTVHDLDSFLDVVTGGGFKGAMFRYSVFELVKVRLPMFIGVGRENLGSLFLPGVALVLLQGRDVIDRFNRRAFLWATFWPLNYGIDDIDGYFMVSFICVCIGLGRGAMALGARLKGTRLVAWSAAAIVLAVAGGKVVSNYSRVDESHDRSGKVFGAIVEAELGGTGAVLLSPNYAVSEALWFLTLGQGLQRSRPVYLVHHVDAAAVATYLRGGVPISLPEQPGASVPPGLRVIAIGISLQKAMHGAGLATVPLPARIAVTQADRASLLFPADSGELFEVK